MTQYTLLLELLYYLSIHFASRRQRCIPVFWLLQSIDTTNIRLFHETTSFPPSIAYTKCHPDLDLTLLILASSTFLTMSRHPI